jgi:hypothetical protein
MIRRCGQKADRDFPRYGGRGIGVDSQWLGPDGFDRYFNFVVNELPLPKGVTLDGVLFRNPGGLRYSLDRVDNDEGYRPDNVRWATDQQQSDNQQRTVWTEVQGDPIPRPTAARLFGVDPRTSSRRQRLGYSVAEAVTLAIGGRTAPTRKWRDEILLSMIHDGLIVVDGEGYVYWRGRDGLQPVPVAPTSNGRYLGVTLTIPAKYHHFIPAECLRRRVRSRGYRDGFAQHRVVALFHHGRPEKEQYLEVHHVNRDARDNRPQNLMWVSPAEHRRSEGDGSASPPTPPTDYLDPAARERAWQAVQDAERANNPPTLVMTGTELPENLDEALVVEAVAAVQADPDFAASIWNRDAFRDLLPAIVRASGNAMTWQGMQPAVTCTDQSGRRTRVIAVVTLVSSNRVFFGCAACGRQTRALRSEIRNRCAHRYGSGRCESCQSLGSTFPALAQLLAPDPVTDILAAPTAVSVGTNRAVAFRCRHPGCSAILMRRPKLLHRNWDLPVCERHRGRGGNFTSKRDTSA